METIGQQKLWTFNVSGKIELMDAVTVRKEAALHVFGFQDLALRVCELQFRNRDFVLLFRGQKSDYKNKAAETTIRPTLLRPSGPDGNPSPETIEKRFEELQAREQALLDAYPGTFPDKEDERRLRRERILRWSILQHYEVCATPLLDVTNSLQIAASFASVDVPEEAYVFVLGLPNLSGAITASVEAGIQIVRLASVCPPRAVRPHIQQGYLLGEYPEMTTAGQWELYDDYEMDFSRRLVAKFKISPRTFWNDSQYFPQVPKAALYPDKDPLIAVANGELSTN
jgi:hypothetical protein